MRSVRPGVLRVDQLLAELASQAMMHPSTIENPLLDRGRRERLRALGRIGE
jgi:hypothetical protein